MMPIVMMTVIGDDGDVHFDRDRDDDGLKADLESAIKVMFLIVGKMAEDRGLSKYQASEYEVTKASQVLVVCWQRG